MGAPGNPLNITTFLDSNFGRHYHGDVLGDGRTSADFSYRLPGFRNWLTLYGETLSEDEPSPIPYMRQKCLSGRTLPGKGSRDQQAGPAPRRRIHQPGCILRDLHLYQRAI